MSLTLENLIKEEIASLVLEYLKETTTQTLSADCIKIEKPPQVTLGHFALACFPLAKLLRKAPNQIAQDLTTYLEGKSKTFSSVQSMGAYVNFFLSDSYFSLQAIPFLLENKPFIVNQTQKQETVVLEYSSPNTNKPLHLGHGRNNVLGMTLSRILETLGKKVVKVNLINDRGIHIAKSMLAYAKWGEGKTPESENRKGDHFVGDFYVLYNQKEKENPDLLNEAQLLLQKWENNDPEVRALWETMRKWTLDGLETTYINTDCSFDRYYYESETYSKGKSVIEQAQKEGLLLVKDNGALVIDLEEEKLGEKVLLRGDGTSMYITQDIYTTIKKMNDFNPDACLFIVGNEQDYHFKVLFTILKKFGYSWADRLQHISYGMITLPDGKMKSREGTVVDLDDLMRSLQQSALTELAKRYDIQQDIEKYQQRAKAISTAAFNFFILRSSAVKEIQFNHEESLSFDGQTGPYLQYTHARITRLLAQASEDQNYETTTWETEEKQLLLAIMEYPAMLFHASEEQNPAILCQAIYKIAKQANLLYTQVPILKETNTALRMQRLRLCKITQKTLAHGLAILGIEALPEM